MPDGRPLRVAIIGSGPAGMYAAGHLLESPAGTLVNGRLEKLVGQPVEVDVLDRLPTPWGLIRGGVAPDHPDKKAMALLYDAIAKRPGFRFLGNVNVGEQVSPAQLAQWYDAVIYAVGAEDERQLGIPGETLPGYSAARQFVGWYNGHPDFADLKFDLDCERAVIIGNGNVAMDVARILLTPVEALTNTDIAAHALDALAASRVTEVAILGRRGPAQAAFNYPELMELGRLPDVAIRTENDAGGKGLLESGHETALKLDALKSLCAERRDGSRRIVFHFHTTPVEILGDGRVEKIQVRSQAEGQSDVAELQAGLVLAAIGYRGRAPAELPFDDALGVIPSQESRVLNGADALPGAYVTGWIRRGPRGIIGSNKKCARDCVRSLMADARAGKLPREGSLDAPAAAAALSACAPELNGYKGWRAIDRYERGQGAAAGRPRLKLTRWDDLVGRAAAP